MCLSMARPVNEVNRPNWFVRPERATEVSLTSSNPAQYCFYMDHWPQRNLRAFKRDVITYQVDTPHIFLSVKKANWAFLGTTDYLKIHNLRPQIIGGRGVILLFSYYLCTAQCKNRPYSQWEQSPGVKEQLFPWCQPLILQMKLLELTELL